MSDENEHQDDTVENKAKTIAEEYQSMSEDELLDAIASGEIEEGAGGFANPLEALAAENSQQEAEISQLKDQMLRTAAEMENLRRRTQKEVADARDFSISKFARDMLGVADNLRRALDHIPEEEKSQPGIKTLSEGVEMTERELLSALEKNGVKMINPEGQKFDPNFHQAMFEVPNTEVPNNTCVQVVQVGYVIGERMLRPAMVGVSKGGPKQAAAPEGEQDPSSGA
jgi:molecular chaperone GrpE